MKWKNRVQVNPYLLRLKNTKTQEIVDYEIQQLGPSEIIEEGTSVTAEIMQRIDDNTFSGRYKLIISADTLLGAEITLPCYYKVGQDTLDVFLNGEKLIKSSDTAGTNGHYIEVGNADTISNKIKLTTDWNAEKGDIFEFVLRGEYNDTTN